MECFIVLGGPVIGFGLGGMFAFLVTQVGADVEGITTTQSSTSRNSNGRLTYYVMKNTVFVMRSAKLCHIMHL